jgi:hypothetical protein
MNSSPADWIGGGVIAGIVVPVTASLALAVAHALGSPVGDLRAWPTTMIVLWGPVLGLIVSGPIAFALGAWAVRRAQFRTSPLPSGSSIVRQSALLVGSGGAVWGAVLAVTGVLDWEIGWILVPVGTVAGVMGGALVSWAVICDRPEG